MTVKPTRTPTMTQLKNFMPKATIRNFRIAHNNLGAWIIQTAKFLNIAITCGVLAYLAAVLVVWITAPWFA